MCDTYASGHDSVYNTKKTVCMCVKSKQLKSNIVHEFVLSGNLKHAANHKYLGVQLTANYKDDTNIQQQCRDLYSGGNMLIRNFKTCTNKVKCTCLRLFVEIFIVVRYDVGLLMRV